MLPLASPTTLLHLHRDGQGIHLHLPPAEIPWSDLWEHLSLWLRGQRRFWQGEAPLILWGEAWLLDPQQLQALAHLLAQHHLCLERVHTHQRHTAIAAASLGYSVEQSSPWQTAKRVWSGDPPLYLRTTIRSGTEIRHTGSVFVLGDLNPGGEIIADGDIGIWGRCRGLTHAGASGDRQAVILALQLDPTQLRIADQVARPPAPHRADPEPEVAYLKDQIICIASAHDFLRRVSL
ncbi:MAG: septum site-determining protein MinC [Cyanobacteriota bacterium]|nr:septum site-determining protein MinC [Cyanobacteriota bacterium]